MTETSHKTPRKSTNRRHDKWIAKAEESGLDVMGVIAVCSMWNAGYVKRTIAAKLHMAPYYVDLILTTCRDILRAR